MVWNSPECLNLYKFVAFRQSWKSVSKIQTCNIYYLTQINTCRSTWIVGRCTKFPEMDPSGISWLYNWPLDLARQSNSLYFKYKGSLLSFLHVVVSEDTIQSRVDWFFTPTLRIKVFDTQWHQFHSRIVHLIHQMNYTQFFYPA